MFPRILDLSFSFGIRVEYQISSDDAFGLTITLSAAITYIYTTDKLDPLYIC